MWISLNGNAETWHTYAGGVALMNEWSHSQAISGNVCFFVVCPVPVWILNCPNCVTDGVYVCVCVCTVMDWQWNIGDKGKITSISDFRQPDDNHLEVCLDAGLYLIPLLEQMFEADQHLWINISEQSAWGFREIVLINSALTLESTENIISALNWDLSTALPIVSMTKLTLWCRVFPLVLHRYFFWWAVVPTF